MVLLLAATLISVSLFATECKNSLTNETGLLKTETVEGYFCGTGSLTLSGECWSATYTVTVCGDYESEAEATIIAKLTARKKQKELVAILTYLEENYHCE